MSKRSGSGYRLTWKGLQVTEDFVDAVAEGWTDVGLEAEKQSKMILFPGHGYYTGTLRRSIHIAQPGWGSDNVKPTNSTPERGGKRVAPLKTGTRLLLQIGSGMVYALIIELGGSFEGLTNVGASSFIGYRYLRNGLAKVKPNILSILKRSVARKFPGRSSAGGVPF